VRDYPSEGDLNYGFRFKDTLDNGLTYSLNYLYGYDPNPSVSIRWEDQAGNALTPFEAPTSSLVNIGGQDVRVPDGGSAIKLQAADGSTFDPSGAQGPAVLIFEETVHRVHNIGASFDTSLDFEALKVPIVLRGEFLYQKDVRVPVIDRSELGRGNLTEGLKPEKTDLFKYVLGLDVTVLTNLLISGQFIQFIDLDYVDENKSSITGEPCSSTVNPTNCGRYTADPAVLHLSNGLKKGEEIDNFLSLFFSKPFGPSQLGRFNNITIYEEGGGWWNRLDLEYSFTDALVGTAEWNHYWGKEDTTFGQFHDSSNFQVGVKYIF
jgi:hypothetical protein